MRPIIAASTFRGPLTALITGMLVVASVPALALAAIPNDHPEQATVIADLPFSEVQDTSGATDSPDDPECAAGDGHSVWFSYTAESVIDVYANTFGSDYDTTLSVWVADAGVLQPVDCNDDWDGLQSQVFWTTEPATTYLIMVGAFGDWPGGNLVFTMDEGLPPPPPPQIDVFVTVTGGSVNPRTGEATIRGEIVCSEFARGFVAGEIRQRAGRLYIYGYFDELIECDQQPTSWSATTYFQSGHLTAGSVRVSGVAIVFDGAGWGFFEGDTRLRPAR